MTEMPGEVLADLYDPLLFRAGRQHITWAQLRKSGPVVRIESPTGGAFWAVLGYETAVRVLSDHRSFSSSKGMRLGADPVATNAASGKMLVITDPPRHGMIRRIISSAFTPRMVTRLRQTMREVAVEVIEEALEQQNCDFADTAARLPVSIICDMLGVPRDDWGFMLDRTKTAFGVGSLNDGPADERARAAHVDLFVYYRELMQQRRREPREDIVSALVHGVIDGTPVTDEEVVLNCNGLISGGNETTRHATIGGLLAFIEHPGQWDLLQRDPAVLPSAIQEILRYTTPAMHVMRTVAEQVTLGPVTLAPDDRVAIWLGSANRDETVFTDPDRFDLSRSPNRHLTFAYGPHFCIGGSLATAELTIMFEELSRRVARAELAGPVVRMASNLIGGYEQLPVRLSRRADR
ncbi:cytochrome P450 [Kribbella sp. NPDC051718]|uniref:cytochrome P450 n=1 Tax=Kribbella sp. NPDC051718 TaxID=3155168 RepID=UPI003415FE7C